MRGRPGEGGLVMGEARVRNAPAHISVIAVGKAHDEIVSVGLGEGAVRGRGGRWWRIGTVQGFD